jgi:hypothetical protein
MNELLNGVCQFILWMIFMSVCVVFSGQEDFHTIEWLED